MGNAPVLSHLQGHLSMLKLFAGVKHVLMKYGKRYLRYRGKFAAVSPGYLEKECA